MLPRRKIQKNSRFFFFLRGEGGGAWEMARGVGDSHVKVTGCPWSQCLEVGITDFGLTFSIQNGKLNFCP